MIYLKGTLFILSMPMMSFRLKFFLPMMKFLLSYNSTEHTYLSLGHRSRCDVFPNVNHRLLVPARCCVVLCYVCGMLDVGCHVPATQTPSFPRS